MLYPSVTLTGAATYSDDRELQRFCVRAYNEWLLEFCADSGGRLIAQAIIPTTGLEDSVSELEWRLEHGHRGAIISAFPNGRSTPTRGRAFFGAGPGSRRCRSPCTSAASLRPPGREDDRLHAALPRPRRRDQGRRAHAAGRLDADLLRHLRAFPRLKLVLVEANIGWIPTLLEQTDDMFLRYRWFTRRWRR